MTGLDFLNLVVGLIFIYLIYSIAASTIWELWSTISNTRASLLKNWIIENFKGFNTGEKNLILDHFMVKAFSKKSGKSPIYISSEIFADVLVDIIINEDNEELTQIKTASYPTILKSSIENSKILDKKMGRLLLQYISECGSSLKKVKEKIALWYDETQERLIGSYKKCLQLWIFIISLVLVGATNADTITLASYLYSNKAARESLANEAYGAVADTSFIKYIHEIDTIVDTTKAGLDKLDENTQNEVELIQKEIKVVIESGLPLGWKINKDGQKSEKEKVHFWDVIKKICGLLLTVFAVSLGAPFWFDVLNKLASIRTSGNKPKSLVG